MNHITRNGSSVRVVVAGLIVLAGLALATPGARADDLKDARTALEAGQYDQALRLFERVASQGFAEGRAGVGQVYLRKREYAKAKAAFEKARDMDGNLALAWYGLGEVERRHERCDAAVPLFRKATELDRKYPEAQLALGECLTRTGHQAEAITALNPGLGWGTKWKPRFLVALGNVEMSRDSLRDAGIYFTQAQQAAPDDPITNRALGDFYLKRRIGSLAIPNYERAVALDSSDVELRFALANALEYDQRNGEALTEYQGVVSRDPEFAPGQLALGSLLYRAGQADPRRFAEAREPLEKYTGMVPDDPRGWSLLGRDYYFLKMKDEAVAAMTKADSLGDKSKELYTVLGRAYVDRKDWQKAIDAYAKGEPNLADQFKIGQMLVILGRLAQADSMYRGMIARDSTSLDAKYAMVELGKLAFRQKDYPATVATMQRRNALDPPSDEAYYYTGLSYKEMKQLPEAIAALRQAATLAPDKADRHFWLGLVLAGADSTAQADAELLRSTEIDSTSKNAAIAYQQLGYRALLEKDWSRAIGLLERSASLNDKDVHTLVWLGQGYQNSGNRGKAIEAYRRVLSLEPDNTDARNGLKVLGT
ncbi:MAG: tetratricopeptide repeat protein [Candidatus Eisenbacteria bacterium]|nr:tetratricopeptide repeat protein [Candidatus Eisenbacteria bacterium]